MSEVKGDARDQRLSGPQSLMHREREHVRKQMSAEALEKCHETRDAYVECAKGRTISLPFMCRGVFKDFNSCLSEHTTEAELDRRLAEYRRPQQNYDASTVEVRDGFKGDFFGTAKARGEQYRKAAAAERGGA
jgi:COX assembly protein 1